MKYIIICSIAMLVCIGAGLALSLLIFKRSKKFIKAISTVVMSILLMTVATLCYMGVYYHADETAAEVMSGTETVTVSRIDGGYYFDGIGDECALIFYGGAKVECSAYAPLMIQLAENGIDCFLADMPFNFAIFGADIADKFIGNYTYDKWIVSGHSMGGMMAAKYASEHDDVIDGIALLAAYSTAEISDGIDVISIYGSADGCLDADVYNDSIVNLPDDFTEYVIAGGNHAGFGNYGAQKGDGIATLTNSEQQHLTAEAIAEFFTK